MGRQARRWVCYLMPPAIPIPCIDMLTSGDVAYRIEHSGARGAVTTAANVSKFAGPWKLAAQVSVGSAEGWVECEQGLAGCSDRFEPVPLSAEGPEARRLES
jgi:acetyl-CoA synthetase